MFDKNSMNSNELTSIVRPMQLGKKRGALIQIELILFLIQLISWRSTEKKNIRNEKNVDFRHFMRKEKWSTKEKRISSDHFMH